MYSINMKKALDSAVNHRSGFILLHLPDGLKPKAQEIVSELRKKNPGAKFAVWAGSCFGSCDLPLHAEKLGAGLILHFGHTEWV